MREVVPHFQSNKAKAGQAGEILGPRSIAGNGGGVENPAASLKSDAPHSAHILNYGQPGKVAVRISATGNAGSPRCSMPTVPVLALCLEFTLVAGASFAAGDIIPRHDRHLPYADSICATMLLPRSSRCLRPQPRLSMTRLALPREQLRFRLPALEPGLSVRSHSRCSSATHRVLLARPMIAHISPAWLSRSASGCCWRVW